MATYNKTVQELKSQIATLWEESKDSTKSDEMRLYALANAYYFYTLVKDKNDDETVSYSDEQVNTSIQEANKSALFTLAVRQNTVNALTATELKDLGQKIDETQAAVNIYNVGNETSTNRAQNTFDQLSSTWRIKWNSSEFNAAKESMRRIAESETTPTQEDYYLAADPVKKYVSKNINKAKSEVGMTRMACALAFLKQTMSPIGFKNYCNELNELRGIPQVINSDDDFTYNKTDPRCIVPDEIGTVKEVYNNTLGNIQLKAGNNKNVYEREFAKLTALNNLAARNAKYGKNLIVEHEALQAEIEKVKNDIRFKDAIQNKPLDELVFMATEGQLNTIDGYSRALTPEQRERFNKNKATLTEYAKAMAKTDKDLDDAMKEQARLENEEKLRREQELKRQRELEEKRRELEALRKVQKPIRDIYKENLPKLKSFNPEADNLELIATLVALGDKKKYLLTDEDIQNNPNLYKKENEKDIVKIADFKQYVETLKNDQHVKDLADTFKNSRNTATTIAKYIESTEIKNDLSPAEQELLFIKNFSKDLNKAYQAKVEQTLPKPFATLYEDKINTDIFEYQNKDMTIDKFKNTIATTLAIREAEAKHGPDRGMSQQELEKRVNEIKNDKSIELASQTLLGPTYQEKVTKALDNSKDPYHAFGDIVEEAYGRAVNSLKKLNKVQPNGQQELRENLLKGLQQKSNHKVQQAPAQKPQEQYDDIEDIFDLLNNDGQNKEKAPKQKKEQPKESNNKMIEDAFTMLDDPLGDVFNTLKTEEKTNEKNAAKKHQNSMKRK